VVALLHFSVPVERLDPAEAAILYWVPMPLVRLPEFVLGILVALRLIDTPQKRNSLRIGFYLLASLVILSIFDGPWLSLVTLSYLGFIYELGSDNGWLTKVLSWQPPVFLGGQVTRSICCNIRSATGCDFCAKKLCMLHT
jgi:peptidoglycan/LPS O-acetylase OafA/YrhL